MKKSVIEKEFHFDKWIRFDNFCPKCNQMLQQKFNYCPNCGQQLDFNNPVKIIVKDD